MNTFFRRTLLLGLTACLLMVGGQSAFAGSPAGQNPPPPPSRLEIPAIELDADVVAVGWITTRQGAEWDVPADAAGWLTTSAPPGRTGNAVLIGHHNIQGKVFRNLKDLAVGDRMTVTVGSEVIEYAVTERLLLREFGVSQATRQENARWIGPFPDERITLVTCWPAWANTHRLIIVAHPVVHAPRTTPH